MNSFQAPKFYGIYGKNKSDYKQIAVYRGIHLTYDVCATSQSVIMKILFITEKFPYPLDSGGRIRTYHILKGLSQEHEITLIATIEKEAQQQYIPELEKVCREVRIIKAPPETTFQLGLKIIKNFFSSVPIVVKRHYLPGVADEVRRQITCQALQKVPGTSFDVVHFDHLDASIYLPCVPETKITVLDEHNIVSNQIKTKDLFVEDCPERFAQQVIRLMTDPELREKISANGRRAGEEKYNWAKNLEKLENILLELFQVRE